ncbi:MAG: BatD family protein [Bacteroidales bacterium]
MSSIKYILTVVFSMAAYALFGQQTGFVASAPATVQAGQQFQYTVEGSEQGNVELPVLEDFELLAGPFTSFSSSTQWVNGKMTAKATASYTYILRGNTAGEFIIPPAKVSVKKENFETNEVKVTIVGSASSASSGSNSGNTGTTTGSSGTSTEQIEEQPVFLRVLPSRRSVYVGEQFVSELKVYTSVNTRPSGGLKELPYEGFYKHTLEADQTSSRENIDGKMHVTQVLQRHILIPQKAGKLVVEPFESEWTVPRRVNNPRSGSMFDQFFNDPFDRYQEVPVTIRTKPVAIDVKPLPAGAPAGFTGGVGDLNFTAALSADQVHVNDAINLVIKISGTGNISLIGTPRIDFPPDHDVYETNKSSNVRTTGNRISGTVTFEYPIVARHAGNFRIPPLSFAWFDPVAERYKSVTTDEFIFTVVKGEEIMQSGQIYMPGSRGDDVENIGTDILDISRTVPGFVPIGKSPVTNYLYWLMYVFLLLLFLILVAVIRQRNKQKADIRLLRNRKANKMARRRMKAADKARRMNNSEKFFEETEKAIWGYLSDKLSIEISALSRDRVSVVLKDAGIAETIQSELLRIIDDCEFSRYAPSSEKSDVDTLYRDAVRLLHNLENNIHVR